MTRDRLVTVFVVLVAAAVGVVVWVFVLHPSRVVHDRPVLTTPIVEPGLTPLPRDSGPRNNARGHASGQAGGSDSSPSNEAPKSEQAPAKRPSPSTTAPKRKTPHKRPAAPQQPSTGGQAPQPPPAQPKPPVSATVPAPVTVCVRGVGGVNC